MALNTIRQKTLKCKLSALCMFALFTVILLSAGCITQALETEPVEIPEDMKIGMQDLTRDLVILENSISADMDRLAVQFSTVEDMGEARDIGQAYYANNTWITFIGYYSADTGESTSIPTVLSEEAPSYVYMPAEEDFTNGYLLYRDCVFTQDHGYLTFYYKAVYDADGKYRGFFAFVIDVYNALTLHPAFLGNPKSYGDFICYIVDDEGKIVYSSQMENMADYILPDKPYFDGRSLIHAEQSDSGAYAYSSDAFYDYLYQRGEVTEKITAWKKVSDERLPYTLYMVKEVNQKPLVYTDVYSDTMMQSIEDTRDLYVYAHEAGLDAAIKRVNSGYYATNVVIMSMNGTVAASSEHSHLGLNYMNAHDIYGVADTAASVLAAGQGGGFSYLTPPVDSTADPMAFRYNLVYIMPLTDEYYIDTMFAGSPDIYPKDYNVTADVTSVSREVVHDIVESGIESVIDRINANREAGGSLFVPGLSTDIREVAVVGLNGHVYASMYYPEVVGESATKYTDVYGGSSTRRAILLAKTGGGFARDLTVNPDKEGYVDLWFTAIEPVSENYYVYTSAVVGTFEDKLTPYLNQLKML